MIARVLPVAIVRGAPVRGETLLPPDFADFELIAPRIAVPRMRALSKPVRAG
ncbi:hypothetical protein [Palleronia caenipelagi]|uniref:hypothetical protein n=1 Tax=Palleronia caenipelagi TaxID=2489174 RepID=UPI00163D7F42|nr:hypothetical protein [Palleronia caenipelagi]